MKSYYFLKYCFCRGDPDSDYENHILRPELAKMANKSFSNYFETDEAGKTKLIDNIVQCVKAASSVGRQYNSMLGTIEM